MTIKGKEEIEFSHKEYGVEIIERLIETCRAKQRLDGGGVKLLEEITAEGGMNKYMFAQIKIAIENFDMPYELSLNRI